MYFHSPDIEPRKQIPLSFTCYGRDQGPQLLWSNPNHLIKSFAIIVDDPDAVNVTGFTYTHFAIVNIPANVNHIDTNNINDDTKFPGLVLRNDSKKYKWSGPCPPSNGPHHYRFTLYALSKEKLPIDRQTKLTEENFENLFSGIILDKSQFIAKYQHF
jgi:Raf kinase inhibitor-like YbhB/YbcL family protein